MARVSLPQAILATLTILVLAAPSAAADSPPPPDTVYPATGISGVAFHGPYGMCYLDHSTCPWPWTVPGNFLGACVTLVDTPTDLAVHCEGLWRDLWFNFIIGGGATLFMGAWGGPMVPYASAGVNDLIHIVGMEGVVHLECHRGDPSEPWFCSTDFVGQSMLVERWDCYIHYNPGGGVDCPNDGPFP